MKVTVNVDGGARGNPGPAGIGVVVADDTGAVIDEAKEAIGIATNNVAEYKALILGLERAKQLGATEVHVINDSELVAKQIGGQYKVKHEAMKPLYTQAMAALRHFDQWSVTSVPRAQNSAADALVNQALDAVAD